MRQKLIITLTTVRGSKQYTLNQLAKYLVGLFLLLSALSFFVSNLLLVKTRDHLNGLAQEKLMLEEQYIEALGTQQSYMKNLIELSELFTETFYEKYQLENEKYQLEEEVIRLDADLNEMESILGIIPSPEQPASPEERTDLLKAAALQRLFLLHSIPNGLPVKGAKISSGFGERVHPISRRRSQHNGIDFPSPIGTPIYATADGIVERAGLESGSGFGNLIILQHNFGFKTFYAHLNEIKIAQGQYVHKGQLIGTVGKTGRVTGPHLHYEVRHLLNPLDPYPFARWGLSNFDYIFNAVEDIPWESLSAIYPLNQAGPQ